MIYRRWQIISIVAACLLGFFFALPNIAPPALLRYLPFRQTVFLGLDLKGGTYIQLQVDTAAAERERLETVLDDVRATLRRERILFQDLRMAPGAILFTLVDPTKAAQAKTALGPIIGVTLTPDFNFVEGAGGMISLRASDTGAAARNDDVVTRSIEIAKRRIDTSGVAEPSVSRAGTDRIIIELPGLDDPERIIKLIGTTAKMSFRMVDEKADVGAAVQGRVPPEDELLYQTEKDGSQTPLVVARRVSVSGDRLTFANQQFDQRDGQPVVSFRFDARGTREFGDVSKSNVGKRFAIVLDNKVITAPNIIEPILQGQGQITGNFTVESANDLAILLRGGALPAPMKILQQRTVGPNLGADAIRVGVYACAIGGAMVVVFMLFFYRLFGIFAALGLVVNLMLLIGALSLLQASLTLPGIVGILLTVGMSVDANVLINERIREEARRGRSALAAITTGFSRAMSTIIDANVTTLLKMVILYTLGSGPVRGFAITISIGILTSMFTSIILVRLFIATWYSRARPKALAV